MNPSFSKTFEIWHIESSFYTWKKFSEVTSLDEATRIARELVSKTNKVLVVKCDREIVGTIEPV